MSSSQNTKWWQELGYKARPSYNGHDEDEEEVGFLTPPQGEVATETETVEGKVANEEQGHVDVFQSTHKRDDSENPQDALKPSPKSSKKSDDKEEKEGAKKKN